MDWRGVLSDFLYGTNVFFYNSSNKQEKSLDFRQKVIADFA